MQTAAKVPDFLLGGGEMGERIRNFDWATTPLGAPETWDQSLKTSVSICLNSNFPIAIYWGKDLILIYNDAWSPIPGNKHPRVLGMPAKEAWKDIWKEIKPEFEKAFEGISGGSKDALLPMQRHGYVEECYFDFTFTPVRGSSGAVDGVFNAVIETTYRVINERRSNLLNTLSLLLSSADTQTKVFENFNDCVKNFSNLLSFVFIYSNESGTTSLISSTLKKTPNCKIQLPFEKAEKEKKILLIENNKEYLEAAPLDFWGEESVESVILPVIDLDSGISHFIVCGLTARHRYDKDYKSFFESILNIITKTLNTIASFEQERKRAEALAEIDKAKTLFFTNISHEFRTPLTLMLGPLEEGLNDSKTRPENVERMEVAHRNAMRLLKLVNALLDFSRIESGRQKPNFVLTDLVSLTKNLVSNFRSATEKAGLELAVKTDLSPVPVYIDKQMWEKIVFNLLSNAFKYTLRGKITVEIISYNNQALLKVQDTGVGIPVAELPHMFERFHRVQNTAGRSFEGTGIGLSLTKELVELNNGTISVESKENVGSTFTVSIPLNKKDAGALTTIEDSANDHAVSNIYIDEANVLVDNLNLRTAEINYKQNKAGQELVMIVDDNADMRKHIEGLLSSKYNIISAINGTEALKKLEYVKPELILSDVMMPVMDGIELLKEIKGNKKTGQIPVILLTARAGEESKIEGLETGADDYLIKPFSSKELIARIDAQIKLKHKRDVTLQSVYNIFYEVPFGVTVLKGEELNIEFINQYNLNLWQQKKEEVIGKNLFTVLPVVHNKLHEAHRKVYHTGERFNGNEIPVEVIKNDKAVTHYFNIIINPLYSEDKKVNGLLEASIDVTEQVLTRKKIEDSEARFRTLAETLPQMVWVRNVDGIIEYGSQGWERYSGIKDVSEAWRTMTHPDDLKASIDAWEKDSAAGNAFMYEVRLKNKKGEYRWHYAAGEPVKDASGKIIKWVGALTDIHVQKTFAEKLELEVEQRTDQLLKANKELESFNYIASHDLQEPLRKIQTFISLIGKNPEDILGTERYYKKIKSSAQHMSELIQSILDYSRLSTRDEPYAYVDLNKTLIDVENDFELLIKEKNARISSNQLPVIRANLLQMHQLFSNLISNSLKFSNSQPEIKITSKIVTADKVNAEREIDSAQQFYEIIFSDNGIGFDAQFKEQIFQLFQRLHDKSQYTGTGIGLSIVKKIVDRHNGFITAKSFNEKGSEFIVWLPVHQD